MNAKIKAALLGDATAAAECTAAGIAIPCPFCGEDAEAVYQTSKDDLEYGYRCGMYCCVGNGLWAYYSSDHEALGAWNHRAPVPPEDNPPLTLEELRGMTNTEWVWVVFPELDDCENCWHRAKRLYDIYSHEHYGKTWIAYRRKPEGGSNHDG